MLIDFNYTTCYSKILIMTSTTRTSLCSSSSSLDLHSRPFDEFVFSFDMNNSSTSCPMDQDCLQTTGSTKSLT